MIDHLISEIVSCQNNSFRLIIVAFGALSGHEEIFLQNFENVLRKYISNYISNLLILISLKNIIRILRIFRT